MVYSLTFALSFSSMTSMTTLHTKDEKSERPWLRAILELRDGQSWREGERKGNVAHCNMHNTYYTYSNIIALASALVQWTPIYSGHGLCTNSEMHFRASTCIPSLRHTHTHIATSAYIEKRKKNCFSLASQCAPCVEPPIYYLGSCNYISMHCAICCTFTSES